MYRNVFPLSNSDDVVIAQVEAFKSRVPILYAILSINTLAMVVTHWGEGSSLLTAYLPVLFVLVMIGRAVTWRRLRYVSLDGAQSRALLKSTSSYATVLATAMLLWACYIYNITSDNPSPGISGPGHAVLYVSLTVVCCMSLLMHVRMAALSVTTVVIVPFCIFLSIDRSIIERAVAINIGLVSGGMLYVIFAFSKDFEKLVVSRQEVRLAAEHEAMMAVTDTLTGLSNRRSFLQVLEDRSERHAPFSLLIIDLDGLKQINDLHGYLAGDAVLQQTAGRIANTYGQRLCLSRLGGDKFAIVCGEIDRDIVERQARTVVALCQQPIEVFGAKVSVGASIGSIIVGSLDFDVVPTRHIERAEYALFHAKQRGRSGVVLYAPDHERLIRRERLVEQTLRHADISTEVSVSYQPIVAAKDGKLTCFEALARWHSSTLGPVSPQEFIPLAEHGEVIHRLTKHVLTTALDAAAYWPEHVSLKVNLSVRDFVDHVQMREILGILECAPIMPSRVSFELTETAMMDDISAVRSSVSMIKAAGVCLAIDDFGTGYSSLGYIHTLQPDMIKVDRSFVARIGTGDNVESIIKTIVELCRNLNAKSIAEGVENIEQAKLLRSLGVDELQGYLISKPLKSDQTRKFDCGLSMGTGC